MGCGLMLVMELVYEVVDGLCVVVLVSDGVVVIVFEV